MKVYDVVFTHDLCPPAACADVETPAFYDRSWYRAATSIKRFFDRQPEGCRAEVIVECAVADVAKVIVESAKVEVNFLKVTGALRATNFIPDGDDKTVPAARRLKSA